MLHTLQQETCKFPTIAICGPATCGKDAAAEYIAANTPLRFKGSTSTYLVPILAKRLGLPVEELRSRKHEFRSQLFTLGRDLREEHPGILVKQALAESDIVAGCRDVVELAFMRAAGLVDLVIWIDRDVPEDPTLDYGSDECDVIVSNRSSLEAFHRRLRRLFGRFAGLWLEVDDI